MALEGVELFVPELAVAREPTVELAEGGGVDAIDAALGFGAGDDEVGLAEALRCCETAGW